MAGAPLERILVTGASGFVGPYLVAALQEAFGSAQIISASPTAAPLPGTLPVHLDLADLAAPRALVEAMRPQACLHLAAVSHIGHALESPGSAWRINLLGALALAEAMQDIAPAAPFVHISTGEVYGLSANSEPPLSEQSNLAPANLYAATKAAADLALGEMALRGLRLVRLRPFNHTGPGQSSDFVVPHIARQVVTAERAGAGELVIGATDRMRDFLDVRDVCRAYVAALAQVESLPNGIALNIASGTSRSIASIVEDLLRLTPARIVVRQEPARLRPNDVERVRVGVDRVRTHLGWEPQIAWSQTLADVLAYWRGGMP